MQYSELQSIRSLMRERLNILQDHRFVLQQQMIQTAPGSNISKHFHNQISATKSKILKTEKVLVALKREMRQHRVSALQLPKD